MYSKTVFALAVLAAGVVAQESGSETSTAAGSLPSISPCILDCITKAASSGGCTSYTDLSCVCTSTDFQTAAATCLQSNCTADEVASALALQQQECANVSGSASATGTQTSGSASATGSASTTKPATSGTGTGTGTAKPTSTSPTSSKPASSGASASATHSNAAVKMGPMTGVLAVIAGFIGIAL